MTGQFGDGFEGTALRIDRHEPAASRLEEPEAESVLHTRGVRHRQAAKDRLPAGHVDHAASRSPCRARAILEGYRFRRGRREVVAGGRPRGQGR